MERDDIMKLDKQLCFTIYACSKEMTKLYRPLLDELGITYPQYLVLLLLWETDGMTVKGLGERLYLDSGTLTPLLKRLETANLVERKRSSVDERNVLIHLTEQGKSLGGRASTIPMEIMKRSGLSAEEVPALMATFNRLLSCILSKKDQQ